MILRIGIIEGKSKGMIGQVYLNLLTCYEIYLFSKSSSLRERNHLLNNLKLVVNNISSCSGGNLLVWENTHVGLLLQPFHHSLHLSSWTLADSNSFQSHKSFCRDLTFYHICSSIPAPSLCLRLKRINNRQGELLLQLTYQICCTRCQLGLVAISLLITNK